MRYLILAAAIAVAPVAAFAQGALQSVTLSPQEYQQVMSVLMQHDPVMGLLLSKEQAAQQAAQQQAAEAAKPADAVKPQEPAGK